MGQSKYTKKTCAIRQVAADNAAGGDTIRLKLNRDWLIAEHKVRVNVSQVYAGGDPASVDVRDFITNIALETSDGRRVFLTGPQAYDLGRFTEPGSAVVSDLTAASCSYSFDVHHENDEALLDLATALRSNEFSTLDMVITFAPDAANGFKGGVAPAAAAYTVAVESYDYEMLGEVRFGQQLGLAAHIAEKLGAKSGTAPGSQPDIQLVTGNMTRFIALHTYDTTGAVPVLTNDVLDGAELRLNINSRDYRVTSGFSIRQDNSAKRGFDQVGVYVIDFGDDENGWLDLRNVNQANIQWSAASTAPAGYSVEIAQDYTRFKM